MKNSVWAHAGALLICFVVVFSLSAAARAGTVGYYVFNEGGAGTAASGATGAIVDSSSDGYNGTAINGPVFSSSVPANPIPLSGQANPTSLAFNGSSQYVLIPNSDAKLTLTQSLTLEAYIYVEPLLPGNSAGDVIIRADSGGADNPYRLTVGIGNQGSNVIGFAVEGMDPIQGKVSATVTATIPDDTWLLVAGTLDNTTGDMAMYVNGQLEDSLTTSVRPYQILEGANPGISIGALPNGGEYFNGMIDDVQISDAALPPSQFLNAPEPSAASFLGVIGAGLLVRRPSKRRLA